MTSEKRAHRSLRAALENTERQLLIRSIQDSFEGLGSSAMGALLCHLSESGMSVDSSILDVQKIERELREIFGEGADILIDHIFEYYTTRAMLGGDVTTDRRVLENLPAVKKILKFSGQLY